MQLDDLIARMQSGELNTALFGDQTATDLNAFVLRNWAQGRPSPTRQGGPTSPDLRRDRIASQLEVASQAEALEDLATAMLAAAAEASQQPDKGRAWLQRWQLAYPAWAEEVELGLPVDENARRLLRYSRRLRRAVPRLQAMLAVAAPRTPGAAQKPPETSGRPSRLAALALQFKTTDGLAVACGRNARANDELLRLLGSSRHLWLHARDYSGSHVILFSDGREVPQSSLEQAAVIAAYHSKVRGEADVDVSYLPIPLIRRPRAAKPGQVLLTGEKTICVRPDAFRDLQDRLWGAAGNETS
jgi:hypothetical protein